MIRGFFNAFMEPFRAIYDVVNTGVYMICNIFSSGNSAYSMHDRIMSRIGGFLMNTIFA